MTLEEWYNLRFAIKQKTKNKYSRIVKSMTKKNKLKINMELS